MSGSRPKIGYPPAQMPFVKALMGDKGDNVPGLSRDGSGQGGADVVRGRVGLGPTGE
jgi:5'-3' exonuclease